MPVDRGTTTCSGFFGLGEGFGKGSFGFGRNLIPCNQELFALPGGPVGCTCSASVMAWLSLKCVGSWIGAARADRGRSRKTNAGVEKRMLSQDRLDVCG